MKKITVIIPTYNLANYLCEAIDSVLNQTFKDFEIIVIDDGSTDSTKAKTDKYNNTIKYFYQKNSGVSVARNKGLKESRGEYIAFLDADDMWLPKKLENSLAFLENGNFDWICTGRSTLTKEGHMVGRNIKPESEIFDDKGRINKLEIGLFNLNYSLAITSTVVIKRKCIETCGLFDVTLKQCEDLDLLLRFKEAGLKGGYLDESLVIKRSHGANLSRGNPLKNLRYTIKVAKKHARILHLDKILVGKLYSEFWWEIALAYYLNGSKWRAIKYSLVSLYFYPRIARIIKLCRYGLGPKKENKIKCF